MAIVERLDPVTTEDVGNRAFHLERYEWAREYVRGSRVLDLACGVGYGSAILAQAESQPHVLGLDRSAEAIDLARVRYASERVAFRVTDDAETVALEERFDTVVSLETLEHLPNPIAFLRRVHSLLAPKGRLIVSAPVRESPGENPYHLHCFTKSTLRAVVSEGFELEAELDQANGAYLTVVARRRETPALAWQEAPGEPRVTIALVTWNGLEPTTELVSAIRAFTKPPYNLVVVDNDSKDGTKSFLRLFQREPGFELVENATNVRCAAASNQAIGLTKTEFLVYLCAQHSLVTELGWDERLIETLRARPDVGIAGDVWNPGYTLPSEHYAPGWTPEGYGLEHLLHVQGGAWIARRSLFQEIGVFDADAFPQGGMDVELAYRLLSRGRPLGSCKTVCCPPYPLKPRLVPGVSVYHPSTLAIRHEVRRRLGWAWEPERPREPARPSVHWRRARGRVGELPGGAFFVAGEESGSGVVSEESFEDVRFRGCVQFHGVAVVRVGGIELRLEANSGELRERGQALARFDLGQERVHFALELEGEWVRLAIDGRPMFEGRAGEPCAGAIFLGVDAGGAVFSELEVEPR